MTGPSRCPSAHWQPRATLRWPLRGHPYQLRSLLPCDPAPAASKAGPSCLVRRLAWPAHLRSQPPLPIAFPPSEPPRRLAAAGCPPYGMYECTPPARPARPPAGAPLASAGVPRRPALRRREPRRRAPRRAWHWPGLATPCRVGAARVRRPGPPACGRELGRGAGREALPRSSAGRDGRGRAPRERARGVIDTRWCCWGVPARAWLVCYVCMWRSLSGGRARHAGRARTVLDGAGRARASGEGKPCAARARATGRFRAKCPAQAHGQDGQRLLLRRRGRSGTRSDQAYDSAELGLCQSHYVAGLVVGNPPPTPAHTAMCSGVVGRGHLAGHAAAIRPEMW